MFSQCRMVTRTLSFSAFLLFLVPGRAEGEGLQCSDADLVIYGLTFETFWTRDNFPKQYPEYRPPPHWSKLIGMSHNDRFVLFRIGDTASKAMKIFSETGRTDFFVSSNNTFDEFYSPSIRAGAGKTEVNFFADGNHTMVSFAAKIVPSPDWFVGVDGLVLCKNGKWIDAITVYGSPIDAGTDSGFTFTAPNWETDPPEKITRITSKYPTHPAGSFNYPSLEELPPIAAFRIKQKKLYRLVRTRESIEPPEKTTNQETTPDAMDNTVALPKTIFKYKKVYKKKRMRKPRYNPHLKCHTDNWSQWSSCNVTCGKGFATRTRKTGFVLNKRCQTQTEEKKCSDYTGCYGKHFEW